MFSINQFIKNVHFLWILVVDSIIKDYTVKCGFDKNEK